MRQSLIFSILCFFVLLFQGCGPVYRTHYDYITPDTQWGRTCVNRCLANKSQCKMSCRQIYQDCISYANDAARPEYRHYLQEEKHQKDKSNKHFHKSIQNFADYSDCSNKCNCEKDYRLCYAQCGGTIITTKKCVLFCPKVNPAS